MTRAEEQALKAYCRELYLEGYNQAKQDLLEQAKIMDETDKRKEALQNERELNPDTFTKEVSADNQALLDAAREYKERTPFQYPNQLQPAYEAFIAGAQWQKQYWDKVMIDNHVEMI